MPDTQIAALATSAIPKVYDLPSSVEFTLKAVNASLDGSGAAGDFLPCVTILSDSGHVIARAVDQAVRVTAGDSAEVSWFPGVKNMGASTPASSSLPFLILTGVQSNVVSGGGGGTDHAWFAPAPVWTNDLGEWTFTLDGSGRIIQIDVDGPGLYYLACQFHFAATGAAARKACAINTSGNVNQTYNDPNFFGTSPFWQTDSIVFEAAMIEAWCPINASGGFFTVEPNTNVAAGVLFKADYLFIVKHPLTS